MNTITLLANDANIIWNLKEELINTCLVLYTKVPVIEQNPLTERSVYLILRMVLQTSTSVSRTSASTRACASTPRAPSSVSASTAGPEYCARKVHCTCGVWCTRVADLIVYKISFKKEGLPSSECFNCFVRHLGTFFGTQ